MISKYLSLPTLPFPAVAVDTETTLFGEPKMGYKTRITPFGYPDLVIATFCGPAASAAHLPPEPADAAGKLENVVEVLPRREVALHLKVLIECGYHLIFHHCAFDIPVILKAFPHLTPLMIRAVDEGRVHDTKIFEVLIQIARGSRTVSQKHLLLYPSLEKLALKRAGMQLDKDPAVRLGFGAYLDYPERLPSNFQTYALQDAAATYRVFCSQWAEAQVYSSDEFAPGPLLPSALSHFGILSETVQVKAALSFAWLEQFPMRVDLKHLDSLKTRLTGELETFRKALVHYGWARYGPKTGRFQFLQKRFRTALLAYAKERSIPCTFTPTGLLSTKHDDWSPHLPKITPELHKNPCSISVPMVPAQAKRKRKAASPPPATETLRPEPEPEPEPGPVDVAGALSVWLRYMRVQKLLITYIYPYSSSERHYPQYSIIGARSTRSSCRAPNIQNIPKRKDGIRAAFIPEAGEVLIERDYHAAELRALAQVYHGLFGRSALADTFNAGKDPHEETARRLVPAFDDLPEADRRRLRQAAKAVNFGLPGGLGARTLARYARTAWGVNLTEAEAAQFRATALKHDPQLATYLAERLDPLAYAQLCARNCGCTWQQLVTACSAWSGFPDDPYRTPNWDRLRQRLIAWRNGAFTPEGLALPPGFDPRFDLTKSHCRTLTGFVRGNCTYTQWHNTPFQSLVASGAKLAMWNLYKFWHLGAPGTLKPRGFTPIAFVHDSVVISCPAEDASLADKVLDVAMVDGMRAVCPDIPITTDSTGPLSRWGTDTNPWGEETAGAAGGPSADEPEREPAAPAISEGSRAAPAA